jgi:hypothetical protein
VNYLETKEIRSHLTKNFLNQHVVTVRKENGDIVVHSKDLSITIDYLKKLLLEFDDGSIKYVYDYDVINNRKKEFSNLVAGYMTDAIKYNIKKIVIGTYLYNKVIYDYDSSSLNILTKHNIFIEGFSIHNKDELVDKMMELNYRGIKWKK